MMAAICGKLGAVPALSDIAPEAVAGEGVALDHPVRASEPGIATLPRAPALYGLRDMVSILRAP